MGRMAKTRAANGGETAPAPPGARTPVACPPVARLHCAAELSAPAARRACVRGALPLALAQPRLAAGPPRMIRGKMQRKTRGDRRWPGR